MQPTLDALPRSSPPPLWFVTNGDAVVGPVSTNLLLRGIAYDRVPLTCLVRERRWTSWRAMDRVREIASLRNSKERYGSVEVPLPRYRRPGLERDALVERFRRMLASARDPGDALRQCLVESMKLTGALVGAVHRHRAPFVGLVTSAISGPGMASRLGQVVSFQDPAVELAGAGHYVCSVPRDPATRTIQHRLGELPACAGVAMVPVACARQLYAVLELGRPDHAFRTRDVERVGGLSKAAAQRLGVVSNRWQLGSGRGSDVRASFDGTVLPA